MTKLVEAVCKLYRSTVSYIIRILAVSKTNSGGVLRVTHGQQQTF